MDFNDDSKLDTSQVDDARGGGGGFSGGGLRSGGLHFPSGGRKGGLGIGGIAVIVVLALVFKVDPTTILSSDGSLGGGLGNLQSQTVGTPSSNRSSDVASECQTGADADNKLDCQIIATINSVQGFWSSKYSDYSPAKTVFFSDQINSGCGVASAASGPFYCPGDNHVYIDLSFFNQLREQFGAQGGKFAQAYVIAHEYGHHVQNLQGNLGADSQGEGAQGNSVRTELQADCYAGVWAHNATKPSNEGEAPLITEITEADIKDALNAASVIGDDAIQEKFQGRVNPDSFTHGSSAQRERWFTEGYSTGKLGSCDTSRGTV